ncbi:hypothetical protein [Candidatus Uabimicrobium amorphum]|uniref:Uncharacterized protein n=1 Tax=Uabimicrobium amorphum TaxID=2596890 RepID=A0A5S9IIE8_UABAM|nr:hypothetical protein [Candidatus Uabimicrobium amorphum]BBM82157.1 hypothetical protein UABAM_00500 [Candidatus Uabimicrobium amorphum]
MQKHIIFWLITCSTLISLTHTQVEREWVKIGGPTRDIALSGSLYAISPQGNQIFKWSHTPGKWERMGFSADKIVVGRHCYVLPKNRQGVYFLDEYSKKSNGMLRRYIDLVKLGGPAQEIRAGRRSIRLWAMNAATQRWYEKSGRSGPWKYIGGPMRDFQIGYDDTPYAIAVNKSTLHRFPNDGSAVYRYTQSKWTKIGGPARKIYCNPESDKILATNISSGDVYLRDARTAKWTKIGGPGKMFAVTRRDIYALSTNDGIYKYLGTPNKWQKIWGPARKIVASSHTKASVVAIHKDTNEVWALLPKKKKDNKDTKDGKNTPQPNPQPSSTTGVINLKKNICTNYHYSGKNPMRKGTLLSVRNNTIYHLKVFRYVGYGPQGEKPLALILKPREQKTLYFASNDLLNGWGAAITNNIPCHQAPPYISFSISYRKK